MDWLKEFDGFDTIHFTKEINGTSNEIELGTVTGKFFYDKNKAHPELCAWDYLHSLTQKYDGITAKKCISGPNMILIDHFLQLGNKETPYYGTDIHALIDDIAKAYQDAILDFYDHGCRYLQIDDTSWTYLIDENFQKKDNCSWIYKRTDSELVPACINKSSGTQTGRFLYCNTFL